MIADSRPSLLDHLAHAALVRAMTALAEAGPLLLLDATCGNGHDSLFLLSHAPPQARLLCMDVQPAALAATRTRLEAAGLAARAELRLQGHQELDTILPSCLRQTGDTEEQTAVCLGCACFNLGWLPGGDKNLVTRTENTLHALEAVLHHLAPQGCVSLHCYTGHPGGQEEAEAIRGRVASLPPRQWRVLSAADANRSSQGESLLVLERLPRRQTKASSKVQGSPERIIF